MNRIGFAALAVLVFVIPWENSVAIRGVGSIARLTAGIALAMGVLNVLSSGRLRRPHAFHVFATAFVVWSGLSLIWAINWQATVTRTFSYGLVVASAWLIWHFARTESRQRALLQAYVLGSFVPAIDTIKNYLTGDSERYMRFSGSNFNPNELAMILVLALPIAWYLCLSAGRRSLALVNACYVPLGMLAVLLSGSRGGFLSALVALLIVPWSLQGLSVRARVGLLLLLVCSLLFIGTAVPQESWQRVGETASKLEQGDLSEREVLWLAALDVFAENPILGVGTANYTYATQPKGWRQTSPHQTFLSVLVGQGLIGLTLFLASYAAAFWSIGCMRGLQRKFWIVLGLTLFIGLLPRTWDYAKPAWFVVGLMTAQSAVGGRAERRRVAALVWPTPSSKPIEPALRPRVGA